MRVGRGAEPMSRPIDARLEAALEATGLAHDRLLGGAVLHENAHLVVVEDGDVLVYDNNGRFVRDGLRRGVPAHEALVAHLQAVAARPPVTPQVRIGLRAR